MLLNIDKERKQVNSDCLTCPYFDKVKKKCNGIGTVCFEFDEKTGTVYEPITHLPIKATIIKDYMKYLKQRGK